MYIHTKVSNKLRGKCYICVYVIGFPGGSDSKEPTCQSRRPGSIPGSGRSPGERNGNPLQYSCLENPMDRGAWWTTAHGVAKSLTRLSTHTQSDIQYKRDSIAAAFSWSNTSVL